MLAAVIVMIAVGFGCNQQRKKAAAYQNTIAKAIADAIEEAFEYGLR